tara:strand:- start:649 stop:1281 length:633 start_codon:yes stop_codon:yes gene_type:complete
MTCNNVNLLHYLFAADWVLHVLLHKKMRNYLLQLDGIFYYRRRVPADLRQHFACGVVCVSLRTKNASVAHKAVRLINDKVETQWLSLRLMHMELPIKCKTTVITEQPADDVPDIIEAAEIYLRLKRNDDKVFQRTARRNASYVAEAIGNKPITSYATNEAGQFRDWCFAKGMSVSSVKRVFNSVKTIINLTWSSRRPIRAGRTFVRKASL